jgi:hypothetical protein
MIDAERNYREWMADLGPVIAVLVVGVIVAAIIIAVPS